jgi:hypothetical protein
MPGAFASLGRPIRETIMSTLLRASLVLLALFGSISSAAAYPYGHIGQRVHKWKKAPVIVDQNRKR